eukprot:TRINITY_DN67654_c4_g1_i2.p2 TRINITY_DN67654_c4_g1~~TRINITY_DN67654_c4_g1_i2.p2  ORF type:complete len:299 (+),score=36.77 TRINITY_DN67654_c4_g1_i2:72-968(+)
MATPLTPEVNQAVQAFTALHGEKTLVTLLQQHVTPSLTLPKILERETKRISEEIFKKQADQPTFSSSCVTFPDDRQKKAVRDRYTKFAKSLPKDQDQGGKGPKYSLRNPNKDDAAWAEPWRVLEQLGPNELLGVTSNKSQDSTDLKLSFSVVLATNTEDGKMETFSKEEFTQRWEQFLQNVSPWAPKPKNRDEAKSPGPTIWEFVDNTNVEAPKRKKRKTECTTTTTTTSDSTTLLQEEPVHQNPEAFEIAPQNDTQTLTEMKGEPLDLSQYLKDLDYGQEGEEETMSPPEGSVAPSC